MNFKDSASNGNADVREQLNQITERNARLYAELNAIDDRREKFEKASSTCRHEPSSMYGGLYDIEEVDDGGRLIERSERGVMDAFVPVGELPDVLRDLVESGAEEALDAPLDIGKKPFERLPHEMQLTELRLRGAHRPAVLIRRRAV